MGEAQINTYTGLDIFRPLWKPQLDERIQLTKEHRGLMDELIRRSVQEVININLKGAPLDKEYIRQRAEFIISQIHQRVGGGYENVYSFSMGNNGIIRFFDKNGNEIYRANLINLWNQSGLPPEELKKIQNRMQEEEQRLKEVLNRESMMGGSIVMEFATTAAVGGMVTSSALDVTRNTLNFGGAVSQRLKAIWVRNPSGKMEKIPLGDMIFQGSKEWMKNNALRMLERVGVYYDPVTKSCINIGSKAVGEMLKVFERLTQAEFKQKYGISLSEAEFYKLKSEFPQLATLMQKTGNSVTEMTSWAIGKGLHVIMFPVFFSAFQRQPNSATLVAGLAEMMAFNQGAKLGGALGKYGGPLGRGLGPIVGGIGGVVLAHTAYSDFDGSIGKWKSFNGRDIFSHKASAALHLATGWGVNEYFDNLNDVGPTVSEKIGSKGGFDIGIPSIDWGKYLPESLAKKGPIGYITGGTGVTPDIDFYKRKAAFNMNPWEWFNASLKGRSVEKWNTMVDAYKENLSNDIAKLLGIFQGNQYPFDGNKTPEEKKKILESRLSMLLLPVGSSMFQQQANSVILMVLSEVSHWNKDRSMGFIQEGVGQYIGYMKIDPTFVRLNQFKIDVEGQNLQDEFDKLAGQVTDTKKQKYIRSVYTRIVQGKDLFEPDEIDDNPFSERVHGKASEEHKIFNSLLDSNDSINRDSIDSQGNPIVEKLETRKLFVILLERLALHSQLIGFQKRISNINSNQNGAEFVEIEAIKSFMK